MTTLLTLLLIAVLSQNPSLKADSPRTSPTIPKLPDTQKTTVVEKNYALPSFRYRIKSPEGDQELDPEDEFYPPVIGERSRVQFNRRSPNSSKYQPITSD
jgi:hypothetical protein